MSSIRIKNLQSASPLIKQQFNEMQFVVDMNEPDTTLKLSGAELKEAVGVQAHGHSIAEVEELQTALGSQKHIQKYINQKNICTFVILKQTIYDAL